MNYVCSTAALCHCNTRTKKPREYIPTDTREHFVIIFNPVSSGAEDETH